MRVSSGLGGVLIALAVLLSTAGSSAAAVSGDEICPGMPQPASMGDSIARAVEFPFVPATNPQRFYDGAILRPEPARYPGKRPVVLLQPGLGQGKCTLWWAAQYLAGHGMVAAIHDTPDLGLPADPDFHEVIEWMRVAASGDHAVIDLIRSDEETAEYADGDRVGFIGYDEGALVGSVLDTGLLEDDLPDIGIGAIVGLDNLRSRLTGDVAADGKQCYGEPQGWFIPVSPALGIAEDEPCDSLSAVTDSGLKLAGWRTWRSYGFATMQLVPRGAEHEDFAGDNGDEDLWNFVGHYVVAWFKRWLEADNSQDEALLAHQVAGRKAADALSTRLQSAAFLPSVIDSDDFTCWLGEQCVKPRETDPDPDPGPDPVPVPGPHPDPAEADLRVRILAFPKRIRRGGKATIRLRVSNRGGRGGGFRICLDRGPLRPVGSRCARHRDLGPGRSIAVGLRVAAPARASFGSRVSLGFRIRTADETITRRRAVRVLRRR